MGLEEVFVPEFRRWGGRSTGLFCLQRRNGLAGALPRQWTLGIPLRETPNPRHLV